MLDLVLDLSAGLVDKLPTPDEDVFKLSTTVNPKQLKLDTAIPHVISGAIQQEEKDKNKSIINFNIESNVPIVVDTFDS